MTSGSPPVTDQIDTTPADASAAGTATDAIIRLEKVSKSFEGNAVLKEVTLHIPRGETTVILGPSGCGKSVTLKHMVGLLRPDHDRRRKSGEVWFEDQRVDQLSEAKLTPIRRQIGFLFQLGALFDSMTVSENIEFPLIENSNLKSKQRRERVHEVLKLVGLEHVIRQMPAELSGGQKKRVALARAIVLEPKVVLYDEPTTGLDPIRADIINELILKLQRDLNMTSVVVTHDMTSAFKVADRMVMLYEGRVIEQAEPDAFRASDHPIVQRFLEGKAPADGSID